MSTEWVKFHIIIISNNHIPIAHKITPKETLNCLEFDEALESAKITVLKFASLMRTKSVTPKVYLKS
ncbi:MAG: hypothetical protein ACTSU2_09370 [Promethearchaeota archaeon]